MAASIFKPHGEYTPVISGHVLIAHCRGSWNIEMHQQSGKLAQPLVEELSAKGPWGCVTVIYESMLTSMEVLLAGRAAVESMPQSSQMVALAWVLTPDLEGYKLMYRRYETMYADLLETRIFDNLASAQEWIEQVIAARSS